MAKMQSSGTAPRLWRGDPGYEDARNGALWNAKKPDRFPDVIERAASDEDVVDAVAFARSRGLRIAIRSGGHSMCGSPVRHGGLLLDLSPLDGFSVEAEHLVTAPSARSVVIASTVPAAAAIDMPDAAFSMVARTFVLPYAIWDDAADDDRNETWLREAVRSIEDRTVGHYVAEADLAAGPSRSTRSFAPENWERLGELKRRHDPENVFHTYLGLEEAPMATVTDPTPTSPSTSSSAPTTPTTPRPRRRGHP